MKKSNNLSKLTKDFFEQRVRFVDDARKVRRLLHKYLANPASCRHQVIVDTETSGFIPWSRSGITYLHSPGSFDSEEQIFNYEECDGAKVFLIQVGFFDWEKGLLYCLYVRVKDNIAFRLVKKILRSSKWEAILHNAKYDIQLLWCTFGLDVKCKIFDTLIAARMVVDELHAFDLEYLTNVFSGDALSRDFNSWKKDFKAWLKREKNRATRKGHPKDFVNYSSAPEELMVPYALQDIWGTWLVWMHIKDTVAETIPHLFKMEMELLSQIVTMERKGIHIDRPVCTLAYKRLNTKAERILKRIARLTKFSYSFEWNPLSYQQLLDYFQSMGCSDEVLRKEDGKLGTDKFVLNKLCTRYEGEEVAAVSKGVLMVRTCKKLGNTYFKKFHERTTLEELALNCTLKQSDTKTTRFASSDPNLTNIPKVA